MTYDDAGQTKEIKEQYANGKAIAYFKLDYDEASRVRTEFIAPIPSDFTESTHAVTHDADNRIATFNSVTVVHDDDGNMTSGPLTSTTARAHTFDSRNRLTGVAASEGVPAVTYSYDCEGNRIGVRTGITKRYAINPAAALSQVLVRTKSDGVGTYYTYYVYGMGLLYQVDDAGNTLTYHYDYRGSTVAITDSAGVVKDRIEYSTYGAITYRSGATDTPFLFNGRYGVMTDPNRLLYMRARYYNPYLRRFINADPAGFQSGMNWYAYADGNPISLLDPFGLGPMYEDWGSTWLRYGSANAGWAFDQAYGLVRGTGALALDALGTGLDFVGSAFGNPNLGNHFNQWANQEYRGSTPAANAGWYDPDHPVTQAASMGMVFLTRKPGKIPAAGRYEFPDELAGGTPYVGQSQNIPARLQQHEAAGRYVPGTAQAVEVAGGKTAREIAEHQRIQELTGGVPARQSDRVSNRRDPIGPRRRHLLEE